MITRRTFLAGTPLLGVRPGSDHGRTGVRPGSDQGRTGVGPGSDRGRTGVGPGSDQGRTRVGVESDPRLPSSQFDPWIEINVQNLRHNVAEIARRAGQRPILAVIKNNGYGLGVANVARLLEPERHVRGFAVVKLHEAVTLRDAGIKKPILLMGPFTDDELANELAPRDIMPMVYRDYGNAFDRAFARARRPIRAHLKVDTGMGRVGVHHERATELVDALTTRAAVALEGVMTTLTEDPAFDDEQLRRLAHIQDELSKRRHRGDDVLFHAASSFALFRKDDTAMCNMVRPGMAIYGIYSEPRFRSLGLMDLRPAVALRTRVALVKQLQAGESAGYERAYVAKQPVWIATLPVGHADGWPRAAAKGARVRIGAALYPVIASVSASHTIVEIGPQQSVQAGDVATLFDWTDGSRPEDVATACGASVYDLTMHLGALLPRRIVEV